MDLRQLLPEVDTRLLTRPAGRRALTRDNPLLFAYLYFPHHLTAEDGSMTLSEFHVELLDYGKSWAEPLGKQKQFRDAFIAPRNSGKTTWLFLLLPMWAAAHQHKRFIAAFSDSGSQAELHLNTFKGELETNARLRQDFPDLCAPAKGTNVGRYLMHNRNQIKQSNGFTFMARGADTSSLGMKVGETRPDVLLFDDIEPGESNYSPLEARKRLETLLSDLFALNYWARVAIVGTTTMPNSIIDQIRKVGELEQDFGDDLYDALDPDLRWVLDQNIKTHYWPAILDLGGDERSFWPERFPLEDMAKDRHTRDFAKNMLNRPVSLDSGYWSDDDVQIGSGEYARTILSVDPAVTTAKASDYTGLAVVSRGTDAKVYVRHAEQTKLGSQALRDRVVELVEQYDCKVVYVETNQGGDLWRQVFDGIPAKFRAMRQTERKELRAGKAHNFYQQGKVLHTHNFPVLEEQMYAFPKVAHDDVVDAVVSGVLYFLGAKTTKVGATQYKYAA